MYCTHAHAHALFINVNSINWIAPVRKKPLCSVVRQNLFLGKNRHHTIVIFVFVSMSSRVIKICMSKIDEYFLVSHHRKPKFLFSSLLMRFLPRSSTMMLPKQLLNKNFHSQTKRFAIGIVFHNYVKFNLVSWFQLNASSEYR